MSIQIDSPRRTTPTTPPPAVEKARTLRNGSRGEDVKGLQEKLNQSGYNAGPADGIYGAKTASAVQDFQKAKGLTIDGVAGPQTQAALQSTPGAAASTLPSPAPDRFAPASGSGPGSLPRRLEMANISDFRNAEARAGSGSAPAPPPAAPTVARPPVVSGPARTLRQGSQGEDVKGLQEKLNQAGFDAGPADGIYGTKTSGAVRDFQTSRGLTVDGIAGPQTQGALNTSGNSGSAGNATRPENPRQADGPGSVGPNGPVPQPENPRQADGPGSVGPNGPVPQPENPRQADGPGSAGPAGTAGESTVQASETNQEFLDKLGPFNLSKSNTEKVLGSAQKALDSSLPAEQRAQAGLETLANLQKVVPKDKLKDLPEVAQTFAKDPKFPASAQFLKTANTLADPESSGLDKAKGIADLAGKLDDLGVLKGEKQQKVLETLGKFGAPLKTTQNLLALKNADSLPEKAKAFVDLTTGLEDSIDSIKDIGQALDSLGVSSALKIGPGSNARKVFDQAADMLQSVGSKLGETNPGKLLGKAGKALGKMLPALGGVVSGIDAVQMGRIAANGDLPPEARFFATMGAGLNGVDTALAVTEAFGVGNVGVAANIGLGVGEFAMDVTVGNILKDHEAGNFKASQEMHAAIGAMSIVGGVPGIGALTTQFGLGGAIDVMKDTLSVGGKYAKEAAEQLIHLAKEKGAEALNDVKDFMKDLPGEVLDEVKELPGEVLDTLGDGLDFLGNLGGGIIKKLPGF